MILRNRFNAFDRFKPKTAPKPAAPPIKEVPLEAKIRGLGRMVKASNVGKPRGKGK